MKLTEAISKEEIHPKSLKRSLFSCNSADLFG
jgi:hypothetical protein